MQSNFQTLEKLVQRIIQRLSMYQGTSVQVYAEDRIMQMVLDQYDLVMDSFAWNNLSHWKKFTLSGIKGYCGEKVSDYIVNFGDIIAIKIKDADNSLLRLHSTTIPEEVTGDIPHYYMPANENADKIFQVVPFTAQGDIYVNIRGRLNTNDTQIDPETVIPFDSSYLVYAVCVDYLADDASSNMQYEKFKNLRDERLRQLKNIDNLGTINYNDAMAVVGNNEWR